ncbi:MAG: bifunctional 23S rRNA (guanine(2069)-N(7))-methyltransferase RlmK/23S rRNA (guanine(2445)-N(2))-methyltransferase RlmL [Magnetococcales bacterium]|nr:bifunctional 23S rRNA (guanine(2069)-N(7))-methyltransferase RlmK/23S rRNA (guanine(2445)-N(2))-methyltransferase RlmL [Magnetococcales bacterium]
MTGSPPDGMHNFFITVLPGLEEVLEGELRLLGVKALRRSRAGVHCQGPARLGVEACLWLRTASRVLVRLAKGPGGTAEALYETARSIPWEEHFSADKRFSVAFEGRTEAVRNSHFGALKVKDALVDRFTARQGRRPSVETLDPDVRIQVHLRGEEALFYLDLAGEALHRRGYRDAQVLAPLGANLAAGMLMLAGWPELARQGAAFCDPMCGSGTLVLEAALLAAGRSPSGLRKRFGFQHWAGMDKSVWQEAMREQQERDKEADESRIAEPLWGFDREKGAVESARLAGQRLGFAQRVRFASGEIESLGERFPTGEQGLLACNPPYGVRLEAGQDLRPLYRQLGRLVEHRGEGWRVAVLSSEEKWLKAMEVRLEGQHALSNGGVACLLGVGVGVGRARAPWQDPKPRSESSGGATAKSVSAGGEMFANRLRKNKKHLERWLRREEISCYRLYDADMPEYNLALDCYGDWAHVQEYQAPWSVDADKAKARFEEACAQLNRVLELPPGHLVTKVRFRQQDGAGYERLGRQGPRLEVKEDGLTFYVNLTDHVDTGLFLDGRLVRRLIRNRASGMRFLNLFGYTGTATVHAAAGGAVSSVTVDRSRTYLEWAQDNLLRNGFNDSRHRLERADCLEWLEGNQESFDLIFVDPPTFSNSSMTEQDFDLQRDHPLLLERCVARLNPGGCLLFSLHRQKFAPNWTDAAWGARMRECTSALLPPDFSRPGYAWRCWRLDG